MKFASLQIKEDGIVIYPMKQTTDGLWIGSDPYFHLEIGASSEEVLDKIISALDESCSGVEHPKDWKAFQKEFLSKIQAKSIKQLQLKGKYLEVVWEEKLKFIPTINSKTKEGHKRIEDNSLTINYNATRAELLIVLEKAINMCQ
jgi:hypothetical protein